MTASFSSLAITNLLSRKKKKSFELHPSCRQFISVCKDEFQKTRIRGPTLLPLPYRKGRSICWSVSSCLTDCLLSRSQLRRGFHRTSVMELSATAPLSSHGEVRLLVFINASEENTTTYTFIRSRTWCIFLMQPQVCIKANAGWWYCGMLWYIMKPMNMGNTFARLRKEHGYTQESLAEAVVLSLLWKDNSPVNALLNWMHDDVIRD